MPSYDEKNRWKQILVEEERNHNFLPIVTHAQMSYSITPNSCFEVVAHPKITGLFEQQHPTTYSATTSKGA